MRSLWVALAILVTAQSPVAQAAGTALSLELPEGPIQANTTVPVVLRLRAGEFLCHEPRDFEVELSTVTPEGVRAVFETSTITFAVPARSYYGGRDYAAEATANLSIVAVSDGDVQIGARFMADRGPCFSIRGFGPASTEVSRSVVAPAPPPPPEPEPEPVPPPPEPTPEPTPTPTPIATPTPTAQQTLQATPATPTVCAPNTACGEIGDYDAPAAAKGIPGAGIALVLAGLAAVALLARSRRR